jgi:hypothetical protein
MKPLRSRTGLKKRKPRRGGFLRGAVHSPKKQKTISPENLRVTAA